MKLKSKAINFKSFIYFQIFPKVMKVFGKENVKTEEISLTSNTCLQCGKDKSARCLVKFQEM